MTPSEEAILTVWKQAGGMFKAAAEEAEKELKAEEEASGKMTELENLVRKDWVAVEMARRKAVFHPSENWDEIDLLGLFSYKDIKDHLEKGKLINHMNYVPENITYWVIPSRSYWENDIKPIVERFSADKLQKSFRMKKGVNL